MVYIESGRARIVISNRQKGFTLIELLVVLIIIGVLASVGVPRYFKAVERARGSEAASILSAVAQAEERYYQRNGVYTTVTENLDVDLPATRFYLNAISISDNDLQIQRNSASQGSTLGWPAGCVNNYNVIMNMVTRIYSAVPVNCTFVLP
ncbi:MAG: prepilin-type N-terminal cleavage/methylation domain-containing protein [Elusimicrobia bacterium]|nr:prepilin-type N-terminal cleavage/methylation domain-containing protein [Elusimicrobiota bacterium]